MVPLSAIDFGRIDAKRELLDQSDEAIRRFLNTFLTPPRFRVEDYLSGRKSFVLGLKGTGKTAALLYIQRKEIEAGSNSEFILFKSDFSEDDRVKIQNQTGYHIAEDDKGKSRFQQDFENEWTLFLAQVIFRKLQDNDEYRNQPTFQKFIDFMRSLKFSSVPRSLSLFPNLKNGQLELGVDVPGFQAKFKSDVELDINTKSISVKSAVDFISSILKRSNNTGRPIVIFIDELDLAHGDDATYNRDAMLIRDLVVVVTRFNDLFNKSKSKIKFITAIRSEVLRSVSTLGKEIYKDAEDLGYEISWDQLGSQARSPLLELVERKIIESEPLDKRSRPDQVWQSYFPPKRKINDEKYLDETDIKRFILHYSWYRPRDIVRMLLGAQSFAGDRTSFNWSDFESDRKTYSQKSWVEHTEELLASYSSEQIAAIKLLLQGAPKSFGFEKFTSICANRSALYESVSRLMRAKQPADVLKDLFRIGIIGNVSNDTRGHTQVRWVFRGDAEILLDRVCVIHRGLWRELSSS